MTFNLSGGSYFGNNDYGFSHAGEQNLMATDSKAVLYVFTPRLNNVGDVALRSFGYNFDENFMASAQEVTDYARRGTAPASAMVEDMMSKTNFANYMMPETQPTMHLRTSQLSDFWRFILIFTENSSSLKIGNALLASDNAPSNVRRIYTGYFLEEPFNPQTFGGHRRTLNPNSVMVITHKTVIDVNSVHGRFGTETKLNTASSEEIIRSGITSSLQVGGAINGGLHLMTPENCINGVAVSDEGYSFATPGAHSDISKDHGASVITDILEQPTHNVAQVVRGMIKHQDDMSHSRVMMARKVDRYFEDSFMDGGMQRMKLANALSLPRAYRSSDLDLDVDARISAADLDKMVNHALEVVPIDRETPQFHETAEQGEASITNMFSFLIASVVGPILNSAGLNRMQMEYQVYKRNGQVHDDFKVYHAGSYWNIPEPDLHERARAVQYELTHGVFRTIFESQGDFHLFVDADATGTTQVRLSLVERGVKTRVGFEIPSFLGGVISPLLGDQRINTHNSSMIEGLFNVMTGSEATTPNYTGDDKNFFDHANGLNFDEGGYQ